MLTQSQVEAARGQIETLIEERSFILAGDDRIAIAPHGRGTEDGVAYWAELSDLQKYDALIKGVGWQGFDVGQIVDVSRRVAAGEPMDFWFDGIPVSDRPERREELAAEIRADEHAARVRDFGEADAATYEDRMAEATRLRGMEPGRLPPGPEPASPEELERLVAEAERQWLRPEPSNIATEPRDQTSIEDDRLGVKHLAEAEERQTGEWHDRMEAAERQIEWIKSMSFFQEEGKPPEPCSDCFLPWWENLNPAEQRATLEAHVDWTGLADADREALISRAVSVEPANQKIFTDYDRLLDRAASRAANDNSKDRGGPER